MLKQSAKPIEFMSGMQREDNPTQLRRQFDCADCGTEFTCSLSGPCWCAEETARLPMPVSGEDCLCRECLRKMAVASAQHAPPSS
jgi:hypothetical protein